MHGKNNADHHGDIPVCFELTDAHFAKEYRRFLEMAIAVFGFRWTIQIWTVHTVNGIQKTMETSPEIANVPHPLEHFIDVNVTRTKAEHRE